MNEQAKIHNVSCELQVFIAVNLIIVDKSILKTIYSMIHIPYLRHGGEVIISCLPTYCP